MLGPAADLLQQRPDDRRGDDGSGPLRFPRAYPVRPGGEVGDKQVTACGQRRAGGSETGCQRDPSGAAPTLPGSGTAWSRLPAAISSACRMSAAVRIRGSMSGLAAAS